MAIHRAGGGRAQGAALLTRGAALLAWQNDLRLSTRLMVAMVALVLLTAIAVGFLTDRAVSVTILPQQLERLESDARWLAAELNAHVQGVRGDVLALRGAASVDGIARARLAGGVDPATGQPEAVWRDQLTRLFVATLAAKPAYVQLRYVGVDDDGREIVRVDRVSGGGEVRVATEAELQAKGDRPYMRETLARAAGETYLSPIELNQEHGVIETPHVPVLRAATPVYIGDGRPFGALIINADLSQAFARLRRQAPRGGQIYVFDDRGDYLVHPDPAREFGFALGHPARVQDDFPELADALATHAETAQLVRDAAGDRQGAALAWVQLAGGPWVGVAATLPETILTASAGPIRRSTLSVALAAVACAVLLAALVARSLTRPLARMLVAVERFTGAEPVAMPPAVGGEIGALARAFTRMAGEVRDRTTALEHEIDERRRDQAELERVAATERLFLAVVESSDDAIVTKGLDGTITAWNPGAERLFGYAAEEAMGRSIEIIVPERRRDEERQILSELRRGERLRHYETVRLHKSGREIAVSLSISPIRSAAGEIVGAAKIARDVTEKHAAEEKFRMAVEASPSGMIMVDRDGNVVLANREAERLFGYSRSELLEQSVEQLVPEALRTAHARHREGFTRLPERRCMGGGRDLFGRRKDGSHFPIEIGLNPIDAPGGSLVLAAVIDITERREAEEALACQTEELQRSNAELEQFAYVASHDLREPLRMVASYTELLADRYRGRLDERADKYINYAVDGAKRMQQLVDDLLAYSRVGTQGKPLRPVDAGVVARRVVEAMQAAIVDSGAEVRCADLPQVIADEAQLGQVFQNLISNALKFRADDRVPRVRIAAAAQGDMWIFSVEDNGIGIETQYSERIFQMFQRLHERGKYEGSGIGLAIAKKIVERHGGEIWLASEPGRGTTFHFSMPASERDV
jgi:PAS domain S-box-containing protein